MIYLFIGLIATAVLLVSVVFDGIFEAFDIDFLDTGFLSVSALSAGAAIFGFVAHFASANDLTGGDSCGFGVRELPDSLCCCRGSPGVGFSPDPVW